MRSMRTERWDTIVGRARAMGLVLAVLVMGSQGVTAEDHVADIWVLSVDGVINSIPERHLRQGLHDAAAAGAALVVVRLNTPGGLVTSMRTMMESILNSAVPVAVYVMPPGARAASAGMFLVLAGHVAAMAPSTNIGAAHPVGMGEQVDPVAAEKLVNEAAALARAIATTRDRNAEWAEQAVRKSVSVSATEAKELGVIDLVVPSLDALLSGIDDRRVTTADGDVRIRTAGRPRRAIEMSLPERLLQALIDPNIAYILFTVGMVGVIAELYNPGLLFPGVLGVLSLVVALVAFDRLPINWAAVLLLVLAVGLLVAELVTQGIGVLAVGGVTAFVLGSLMLYSPITPVSPAMPDLHVSPWLIATLTVGLVLVVAVVIRALLRAQQAPVTTGTQALIGRPGQASTDLDPEGTVRVEGEMWRGVAEADRIRAGEAVEVIGVEGVTLRVKKSSSQGNKEATHA